jgi:hypothetical protein
MSPTARSTTDDGHDVVDLRHLSPPSASLLSQLRAGLSTTDWRGSSDEARYRFRRSLPTMLLYDERGLQIYEKSVIPSSCAGVPGR